MIKTHDLKTWPEPFIAIFEGRKRYEIRRDDRGFEVGDFLRLREWVPGADVYFFAWLDDATCYGTLVEIGIAHSLGKRVYIGHKPKHDAHGDMWFADEAGIVVSSGTPVASLRRAIEIERERH